MTTESNTTTPYCMIFKKESPIASVPMHMMYLAYENISYQICIPFHKQDVKINYAGRVDLIYAPPLIFTNDFKPAGFQYDMLDLSSTEQLKGQEGPISFKAENNLFTDAYNTKTRQFVKKSFISSQITKYFLADMNLR